MTEERGFGVRLSANVDAFVSGMSRASASTASFTASTQANLTKVGGDMQKVGGFMTRSITLPLVAAGVGALKLSSDFDTAFGRMVGLAGVTAGEVDGLKQSVLDLAGKTGRSPLELADALYFASSAGLTTAQAMDAVTLAAQASAAGMGKTQAIVGLVASATAAYGAANISAAKATDILTASVRLGRADPEELAGSLGRLLPVAAQVGVSFAEVGAATAFLSNITGNTAATVTQMQGVLIKLVSPTQQGRDALRDMGTSVDDLQAAIKDRGLLGALDLLREKGFGANQQALRHLFDDSEGYLGALALLNDNSGKLASTLDQVTNSAGATDTALAAASETGGFKMKQAWAEIQVALIKAGEIVLPIVAQIAGGVGHLAEIFSGLPRPVQTVVVGLLAFVAAAGPLILITGTLLKNFMQIRSTMALMSTQTAGLGTAARIAGGGFVVLAAAVTGLQVLDQLTGRTGDTTDELNHLIAAIGGANDAMTTESALALAKELGTMANAVADNRSTWSEWQTSLGTVFDDGKYGAIGMKEAFDQLLKASPAEAQKMVDALNQVAAAASLGDQSAKDFLSNWGINEGTIDKFAAKVADAQGAQTALTESTTEQTAATVDAVTKTDDLAAAAETATRIEKARKDAIQAVTDALNRQVESAEKDLKAQMALVDFARGAVDAQYALTDATDAYSKYLEELPAKLKEIAKSKESDAEKMREIGALYREGGSKAAEMADKTVAAFQEASDGTLSHTQQLDIWNQKMIAAASQASGPTRKAVLDFVLATNEIPADKATLISALVDAGKLDEANALLTETSSPRVAAVLADGDETSIANTKLQIESGVSGVTSTVRVDANMTAADAALAAWATKYSLALYGKPDRENAGHAEGGYVGGPMISTLGEGGLPEVVLPLTKAGRMRSLLGDPRVLGPVMRALGFAQSAEGRMVNISHTTIPAASSSSGTVSTSTGGNSDSLMANKFERGAISLQEYRAYLAGEAQLEDQFSERGMQLWRTTEQLKRNELQATADAEKAAQRIADENQQREDDRMRYLFDTQQISLKDYQDYLAGRQASYVEFSKDWLSVTREMQSLQDQAAKDAVASAEAIVRAAFQQMRVQQELTDAVKEQADSYAELQQAGTVNFLTAMDSHKSAEEKAQAQAAYDQARKRAADAVIRGVDAQANAAGFEDGTPGWASYVRAALVQFIPGHADIADLLNAYLATVPAFADGGIVRATAGGLIGRIGEAGHDEVVAPLHSLPGMLVAAGMRGGGATYVDNRQFHITGAIDRPGVARELREILAEDDRRNGRPVSV